MSENVPIGHTAEQYTRPNKKVIRSHTIVAPNVTDAADSSICSCPAALAIGCICGPIMRQAAEAAKNSAASIILMARSCFILYRRLPCCFCCSRSMACCWRCISSRRAMKPDFFFGFFAFSFILALTVSSLITKRNE